jgi:hypothetical protein
MDYFSPGSGGLHHPFRFSFPVRLACRSARRNSHNPAGIEMVDRDNSFGCAVSAQPIRLSKTIRDVLHFEGNFVRAHWS